MARRPLQPHDEGPSLPYGYETPSCSPQSLLISSIGPPFREIVPSMVTGTFFWSLPPIDCSPVSPRTQRQNPHLPGPIISRHRGSLSEDLVVLTGSLHHVNSWGPSVILLSGLVPPHRAFVASAKPFPPRRLKIFFSREPPLWFLAEISINSLYIALFAVDSLVEWSG